ncbi:hypothetical protein ACTWP5_05510 [Streptomyces sp. 4N509B]|uniref:hypothetical protein n=1 Tax=Streptomyces sp. 4N509B TaxID=3457413 RepID=UPI003FD16F97
MRMRHLVSAAAAAAALAVAVPTGAAHGTTGELRYHTMGGNTGTVDLPEPYTCYLLADPEEPVMGGFNNTVFDAVVYSNVNCTSPREVIPPTSGFESGPVYSVKFYPPADHQHPRPPRP